MIRCPICDDRHEAGTSVCPGCGTNLDDLAGAAQIGVSDTASSTGADQAASMPFDGVDPASFEPSEPGPPEAPLGIFHPMVATGVTGMVRRRGVAHVVVERDDEVELRVDPAWRDDLRTELMLTWDELLGALDPDDADVVRESAAGTTPGWLDAPRGGYIDRSGRLVVSDADDPEDARIVGPALITVGAILAVISWSILDSDALLTGGIGMVVLGLLLPR